jgi:HPt (histidine-containing phosphotransfer) domain-containing protein
MQADLFARYALQAKRLGAEIAAAVGRQDVQEAREQAHKLKSSSATVGANALAGICLAIEQASSLQDFGELTRLGQALDRELLRTLREIEHLSTRERAAELV